jgi:hypothetical protein
VAGAEAAKFLGEDMVLDRIDVAQQVVLWYLTDRAFTIVEAHALTLSS